MGSYHDLKNTRRQKLQPFHSVYQNIQKGFIWVPSKMNSGDVEDDGTDESRMADSHDNNHGAKADSLSSRKGDQEGIVYQNMNLPLLKDKATLSSGRKRNKRSFCDDENALDDIMEQSNAKLFFQSFI